MSSQPNLQVIFPQVFNKHVETKEFCLFIWLIHNISFRFLALSLRLQHLDDNLLLLNQEGALDPER